MQENLKEYLWIHVVRIRAYKRKVDNILKKVQASLVISCHYRFTSGDLNIDLNCIVMNTILRQLPWAISSIRIMTQYKLMLLMLSSDQQNFLKITFIYLRLLQWKEGFHHHICSQSNSTSQMFQKIHIPEPLCRFLTLYS